LPIWITAVIFVIYYRTANNLYLTQMTQNLPRNSQAVSVKMNIPFTKPYLNGLESEYIQKVLGQAQLHGNGPFTKKAQEELQKLTGSFKVLLTNSCTAALEMSALLAELEPGDEIIMPSYTFVSTANAIVIHGGVPVFVDARADTLNIDESMIEAAITPKTKAIMCMHYAGVACEMDAIMATAKRHNLLVIEDAAQGIDAYYKGKALGSIGHLGALSFHGTKNIISGEGGALLVNDQDLVDRAEIIWEKGTNRKKFMLGEVDKYSWVDKGSSFLPSEITAAFLTAQLQDVSIITNKRLRAWSMYNEALAVLEDKGCLRRPIVLANCKHNAHIYYVLLNDESTRNRLLDSLKNKGIQATAHYVPLHDSVAGLQFCRSACELPVTHKVASTILRLPLFADIKTEEVMYVVDALLDLL